MFTISGCATCACRCASPNVRARPPASGLVCARDFRKRVWSTKTSRRGVLIAGWGAEGDITRDGNLVTLHIVAKEASNQINNPTSLNIKDTVKLRSYGGRLTGPIIEAKPGTRCGSRLLMIWM